MRKEGTEEGASGQIEHAGVARGRAQSVSIAAIEREDVGLHIVEGDEMNVLGMNFLSTLTRWGVEGRWLILEA